ncbi:T9SS type B sorting domain-containing protein [Robertkochia solimangrovi]|uniref:T9SS type B sorting domain-containing protein n=1 Tax=Robertkochia solimangrovi TaxID=2213046 RepID=UPI00117C7E20|nr:T9SS type B sorting domain-containing protein [Robertkochia solimangrovi]TRZ45857.1 hypothetical protein DMZ48_00835 [Robertkochia solimangrovi]
MFRYLLLFLLLTVFESVTAQLCGGNYGEPVFTEDFGNNSLTGAIYGPALPAGVTTYRYKSVQDVQDGEYTISINGRYGLDSFFDTLDHTDDDEGEGYMLIVNADYDTGAFYRRTVSGLCEGQVFEFSAYFMNLLVSNFQYCDNVVPNNIIFQVEDGNGNVLGNLETGDINSTSTPQWRRYSFDFRVPSGVDSVEVVLINNGPGGCGNDLAIDDISFRACSSLSDIEASNADFESGVCKDDALTLELDPAGNPFDNPAFQWQRSVDDGNTWIDLNGETGSQLIISGFEEGWQYRYMAFEASNADSPNCMVASQPAIISIYAPEAGTPDPMLICDSDRDGLGIFNLTAFDEVLRNGRSDAEIMITYYESLNDASTNTNPIVGPETYESNSPTRSVYARLTDIDKGCYAVTNVDLELHQPPAVPLSFEYDQCDPDGDGITFYDLSRIPGILSLDSSLYTFYFYTDLNDARDNFVESSIVDIAAFRNDAFSTIYLNTVDEFGCFDTTEITLGITAIVLPADFEVVLSACDVNGNGVAQFDLNSAIAELQNTFSDPSGLIFKFYHSEEDALLGLNEITDLNYVNSNSAFGEILIVKIEDANNGGCVDLGPYVRLQIELLPEIQVISPVYLCDGSRSVVLRVSGNDPTYRYEWYDATGHLFAGGTRAEVFSEGDYTVKAISASPEKCESEALVTVLRSSQPVIAGVEIDDGSIAGENTIEVIATGMGDYEYSIDGINYVETSEFEGLSGGKYNIYVRDRNGCGTTVSEICVVGFPNYFSPNGDGVNDTWQAYGLNGDCADHAIVFVYDRYGKLLKQMTTTGSGWDGNFNGSPLPASDYWFRVENLDGTLISKGHFTLKR